MIFRKEFYFNEKCYLIIYNRVDFRIYQKSDWLKPVVLIEYSKRPEYKYCLYVTGNAFLITKDEGYRECRRIILNELLNNRI